MRISLAQPYQRQMMQRRVIARIFRDLLFQKRRGFIQTAFRHQGLMVFQLQLSKRVDTLPLTRDYMLEGERTLARRERSLEREIRIAGE